MSRNVKQRTTSGREEEKEEENEGAKKIDEASEIKKNNA